VLEQAKPRGFGDQYAKSVAGFYCATLVQRSLSLETIGLCLKQYSCAPVPLDTCFFPYETPIAAPTLFQVAALHMKPPYPGSDEKDEARPGRTSSIDSLENNYTRRGWSRCSDILGACNFNAPFNATVEPNQT